MESELHNKISIITVTNKPQNLLHIARQACSQAVKNHIKIEHVIVCDGFKVDEVTKKQLSELYGPHQLDYRIEEKDPQPTRYLFEKLAALRNQGVDISKGNYLAFWDDDNQWNFNHLQSLYDVLNGGESAYDAVHSYRYLMTREGEPYHVEKDVYPWATPTPEISKKTYDTQQEAGILEEGSSVVRDVCGYGNGGADCSVDTGEWLFQKDGFERFNESLSLHQKMVGYTDDQLLGLKYIRKKVACSNKPTLMYYLGGCSQNNEFGSSADHSPSGPLMLSSRPELAYLAFLTQRSTHEAESSKWFGLHGDIGYECADFSNIGTGDRVSLYPEGYHLTGTATEGWNVSDYHLDRLYKESPYVIGLEQTQIDHLKKRTASINWSEMGTLVENNIRKHLELSDDVSISCTVFGSLLFKSLDNDHPGDLDIAVVIEKDGKTVNVGSPVHSIQCAGMNQFMPEGFKFREEVIDLSVVERGALCDANCHSGDLTNIAIWAAMGGLCVKGKPLLKDYSDYLLVQEILTSIGFSLKGSILNPNPKLINVLIRSYQSLAYLSQHYDLVNHLAYISQIAAMKQWQDEIGKSHLPSLEHGFLVEYVTKIERLKSDVDAMAGKIKSYAKNKFAHHIHRHNHLAKANMLSREVAFKQLDYLLNHQRIIHNKNKKAASLAVDLVESGVAESDVLKVITREVKPIIPVEYTHRDQPMPDKRTALIHYYWLRYKKTADEYYRGQVVKLTDQLDNGFDKYYYLSLAGVPFDLSNIDSLSLRQRINICLDAVAEITDQQSYFIEKLSTMVDGFSEVDEKLKVYAACARYSKPMKDKFDENINRAFSPLTHYATMIINGCNEYTIDALGCVNDVKLRDINYICDILVTLCDKGHDLFKIKLLFLLHQYGIDLLSHDVQIRVSRYCSLVDIADTVLLMESEVKKSNVINDNVDSLRALLTTTKGYRGHEYIGVDVFMSSDMLQDHGFFTQLAGDYSEYDLHILYGRSQHPHLPDSEVKALQTYILCEMEKIEKTEKTEKTFEVLLDLQQYDMRFALLSQSLAALGSQYPTAFHRIVNKARSFNNSTCGVDYRYRSTFFAEVAKIKGAVDFNFSIQDQIVIYILQNDELDADLCIQLLSQLSNTVYLEVGLGELFQTYQSDKVFILYLCRELYSTFGVLPESDLLRFFLNNRSDGETASDCVKRVYESLQVVMTDDGRFPDDLDSIICYFLNRYRDINPYNVLNYSLARFRKHLFIAKNLQVDEDLFNQYIPKFTLQEMSEWDAVKEKLFSGTNPMGSDPIPVDIKYTQQDMKDKLLIELQIAGTSVNPSIEPSDLINLATKLKDQPGYEKVKKNLGDYKFCLKNSNPYWMLHPIDTYSSLTHSFRYADSVGTCLVSRHRMYNTDVIRHVMNPATMLFDIQNLDGKSVGYLCATLGVEILADGEKLPVLIVSPVEQVKTKYDKLSQTIMQEIIIEKLAPMLGAVKVYSCGHMAFQRDEAGVLDVLGFKPPDEGSKLVTVMALSDTPVCHFDTGEKMNCRALTHSGVLCKDLTERGIFSRETNLVLHFNHETGEIRIV